MKKIILIGKMNKILEEVNKALSAEYQVQIASDNANVAIPIIAMTQPDLILISMVGALDMESKLFEGIRTDFPAIPVLTLGTETEVERFAVFFVGGQFQNLKRPIQTSELLEAVRMRVEGVAAFNQAAANGEIEVSNGKKNIMVVDDNAATLRSIKGMLEEKYNVAVATSGIKALTLMGKKKPDLILLDYEMPVVDGKQTLEMIKADEDLASIPVIFLTGVSDKAHIQAVLELRPNGYMLKPPVAKKLYEAIDKALA